MSANHVIATEKLSRQFDSFEAVKEVDLRVPAGVVYGFLGPNGAGKTTTIRMLLDLIRPTAGQVYLFGKPFSRRHWPLLRQVGALIEAPSLYPHLTGRENLEVVRRLLDLPRQNIDQALQIVRLAKDGNRLVKHYSLGMKQRLALALALAMLNEPRLLILNEPTNGLDPSGIQEIRAMIRDMPRKMGVTVFLSSHLLSEVELMATHVGIIQQGRLLFQGELSELKQQWVATVQIKVDRMEAAAAFLAGLTLLSTLVFALVNLLGGVLVHFLRPELGLAFPIPAGELIARPLLGWLLATLMLSLHLWLSLRWPSFVVSITVGFAASVSNIFLVASHLFTRSALSPWAMPVHAYGDWGMSLLFSLAGAVSVYLLARHEFIHSDAL